jgi:hypothetical protein
LDNDNEECLAKNLEGEDRGRFQRTIPALAIIVTLPYVWNANLDRYPGMKGPLKNGSNEIISHDITSSHLCLSDDCSYVGPSIAECRSNG